MSLLDKAKPFLNKLTSQAIDLIMTRDLIKSRNRIVLSIFNQKLKEENERCKQAYYQLEEIEQEGLFKRLLLQELYFFGETIGEKSPKKSHEDEADRFIDWVYDIATREEGEKSDLSYESDNIRAAIMLVASEETFNKWGIEAYIRRAKK